MSIKFAEKVKLLPLLAPVDIAATETASAYIDLQEAQWASFLVDFGVITGDDLVVTLECSTAASSNATEAAVPFSYRLSSAVATDSMGAITAATSNGATIAVGDDDKDLLIDLDPASIPSNPGEDFRYARVVIAPASDMTVCLVGVHAVLEPRYPGNAIASAT